MLVKNVRPNDNGEPVELRIGEDITIRIRIGEKNVQMAIDAPKDKRIAFSDPAIPKPH